VAPESVLVLTFDDEGMTKDHVKLTRRDWKVPRLLTGLPLSGELGAGM
jgi:hypothetical protein